MKAWNVEEMQAYSELIALGQPDFIEVKVGLISFLSFQYNEYSIFVKYGISVFITVLLYLFLHSKLISACTEAS